MYVHSAKKNFIPFTGRINFCDIIISGRKIFWAGNLVSLSEQVALIVNPKSRIGKNCTIHGNCCIGSKGGIPDDSPVIGDNVDIGQNAQILGGITVADGVRIGAGAIVTKSILIPDVTVVGIPAKVIEK